MRTDIESPTTLVVSDLDGTLLRRDGTLSSLTIKVINQFISSGGLFTYATARSFTAAAQATSELALVLPVVTYGGAMMVDPRTGTATEPHFLSQASTRRALRAGAEAGLRPVVFVMHEGRDRLCWLRSQVNSEVQAFLARRVGDPRLMPLETWGGIDSRSVFYIAIHGERPCLTAIRDRVLSPDANLVFSPDVYRRRMWSLELTSSSATKANAVSLLADQIGATRLVCFGDAANDLGLFARADYALAVGNAETDVRAAAHEVIGSNDDDGVANWLGLRTPRTRTLFGD